MTMTTLRLPERLKTSAQTLAAERGQTFTSFVNGLIADAIAAQPSQPAGNKQLVAAD